MRWRVDSGDFLMRENPVRGYDVPGERNPRRPHRDPGPVRGGGGGVRPRGNGAPSGKAQRHLADKRLRKAERLAGLESQRGSLWHAYRRKWAAERKHHPDVDVAAAGGWKIVQTLKTAYQQADEETMLRVVLNAQELRDLR